MLYDAYEVQRSLLAGASKLAGLGAGWLNNPSNPFGYSAMGPVVAASLEVFAHAAAPRGKPEFGIENVKVGRKDVVVAIQPSSGVPPGWQFQYVHGDTLFVVIAGAGVGYDTTLHPPPAQIPAYIAEVLFKLP